MDILEAIAQQFSANDPNEEILSQIQSDERPVEDFVMAREELMIAPHRHKKKIYLDLKFWLELRKIVLKTNTTADYVPVYEKLTELVSSGKAICPVSYPMIFELLKQSDLQTRRATAQIMGDLSQGVAFKYSIYDISALEIQNTAHYISTGEIRDLAQFCWTDYFGMIGLDTIIAKNDQVDPVLRKYFLSMLSKINFADAISLLGGEDISPYLGETAHVKDLLNKGKEQNTQAYTDYKDLEDQEWIGAIKSIVSLFPELNGILSGVSSLEQIRPAKRKLMPFLAAYSGLHASIRFDQKRRYKDNDDFDIEHGAYALAYFDIFLTEKSLGHLIANAPGYYEKHFNVACAVQPVEALSLLRSL